MKIANHSLSVLNSLENSRKDRQGKSQIFYQKNMVTGWHKFFFFFFIQIASNFRRPLQSLVARYTA